jgi:hypothetical protein
MHTEKITVTRAEAETLYRKYREHVAYSDPIDWEIQRTYDLLRSGKVIIRAIESIKKAGLDREFLPKLALAPATAKECFLTRYRNGSMRMSPYDRWSRSENKNISFIENTFEFPTEVFPVRNWGGRAHYDNWTDHKALVPIVPIFLRPKRGLQNYSILWEAEWRREPPRDPYLLRRIGKADLWLVVAVWDLTEVERAALSTRV